MTCGFCGQVFEEDRAQPTCQACPLARGCRAVRCPHCGYENPATPAAPAWVAHLRRFTRSHWQGGTP